MGNEQRRSTEKLAIPVGPEILQANPSASFPFSRRYEGVLQLGRKRDYATVYDYGAMGRVIVSYTSLPRLLSQLFFPTYKGYTQPSCRFFQVVISCRYGKAFTDCQI